MRQASESQEYTMHPNEIRKSKLSLCQASITKREQARGRQRYIHHETSQKGHVCVPCVFTCYALRRSDRHARLKGKRIGETSFFWREVRRVKIARQIGATGKSVLEWKRRDTIS